MHSSSLTYIICAFKVFTSARSAVIADFQGVAACPLTQFNAICQDNSPAKGGGKTIQRSSSN